MIIEGAAVVIAEANVNTDVLYPGPFLNIDDPQQMKHPLFEGLDPTLRDLLVGTQSWLSATTSAVARRGSTCLWP